MCMKNKEAQEVIEKAKDKELEEVENAIGIKGWDYVKEKLRDLGRHKYQGVAIRHDKDTVEGSSFFKPSLENRIIIS